MKITKNGVLGALFLGLLPFFTLQTVLYPDINSKLFLVIFFADVLLLFAAWYAYTGEWRIKLRGRFTLGVLVLVLATSYLSAYFGVFLERSLWSDIFWSSGALFFTHLVLISIYLGESVNECDWSLMRRSVAVSAGVFGLLTLVGVNGFGASGYFLWINLGQGSLTLGNETYAGAYLLLAFIIALIELARTERGSVWQKLLIGSALCVAVSPLLTNIDVFIGRVPFSEALDQPVRLLGLARSSSGALFALLGFLAGHFLIQRFMSPRLSTRAQVLWGGTVLVALIVAVGLLFVQGSVVQDAYIESSSAARPLVWESGWNAFLARPLLGWGPENFNYAFEAHFDNRLFQGENLGEIWFERAHNIVIDTLVSVGIVGAIALVLLILAYLLAVYRATRTTRISHDEAVLLYALVPAHLLQMQTGFDTVGSYTLLAFMCGYALFLERQIILEEGAPLSQLTGKIVAGVLIVLALASFKWCLFDEYTRQTALLKTLTSITAVEQKSAIARSLARVSSFESLRFSSSSFIKGSLAFYAEAPTPDKRKIILEFASVYEEYYKRYLTVQPEHYRAHMNYAYLLLIKTVLGENRITDAKALIRDSYVLSPGNPLTYIMHSLTELYGGNLKEADRLMQEALAINPNIEFTQEAAVYLEKQKKQFPNISVLKISNL